VLREFILIIGYQLQPHTNGLAKTCVAASERILAIY